jgi:hypothetical protein
MKQITVEHILMVNRLVKLGGKRLLLMGGRLLVMGHMKRSMVWQLVGKQGRKDSFQMEQN